MVVEAQFFRQNTYFLKNNRALSKFLCGIFHYLTSIAKLSKKWGNGGKGGGEVGEENIPELRRGSFSFE